MCGIDLAFSWRTRNLQRRRAPGPPVEPAAGRGFDENPQFSDDSSACMVWSEAIHAMLLTHAKWRTLTDRPLPPPGPPG